MTELEQLCQLDKDTAGKGRAMAWCHKCDEPIRTEEMVVGDNIRNLSHWRCLKRPLVA